MVTIPVYLLTLILIAVLYFSYRDRQDASEERQYLISDHQEEVRSILDRLMAKDFTEFKSQETYEENLAPVPPTNPEEVDLEDAREEIEA